MKAKRVVGVLAALLLCICMIMPVNTDAAAQVRVRTVKGVTSSYTGRKSYCYVNGQKRKLTKYPIFKKSGAYMGPVGAILKNSKLKVKATAKGDKLTLTYGPNTVIVRADSRIAVTNGQKSTMGAPVVHGTYTATGKRRWIVPLNSVCTRLGINYKLSNGKIYISGTTQSSSNNTTGSITTTTTTTKPSTTSSKDKIKIVIDAGHGGSDSDSQSDFFLFVHFSFLLFKFMYSRNLFMLDLVRRFFVSCSQIFEAYAMHTLMKFGCGCRKISHKSKCRKYSESTYFNNY